MRTETAEDGELALTSSLLRTPMDGEALMTEASANARMRMNREGCKMIGASPSASASLNLLLELTSNTERPVNFRKKRTDLRPTIEAAERVGVAPPDVRVAELLVLGEAVESALALAEGESRIKTSEGSALIDVVAESVACADRTGEDVGGMLKDVEAEAAAVIVSERGILGTEELVGDKVELAETELDSVLDTDAIAVGVFVRVSVAVLSAVSEGSGDTVPLVEGDFDETVDTEGDQLVVDDNEGNDETDVVTDALAEGEEKDDELGREETLDEHVAVFDGVDIDVIKDDLVPKPLLDGVNVVEDDTVIVPDEEVDGVFDPD